MAASGVGGVAPAAAGAEAVAAYAWEPTDDAIAARYGLPVERIARFDTNTPPAAPDLVAEILATRSLRGLSEYPPADYARLVSAAAERYGVGREELIVGAGADEVLDLVVKAFLPPGGTAIVPVPTYAMFEVLSRQRPANVVRVPRRPAGEGFGLDVEAVRSAAAGRAAEGSPGHTGPADIVWLCSPNNPTALPERDGVIEGLLGALDGDAAEAGRSAPLVVLDEAYAEFTGGSLAGLRAGYPRLVVIRTLSKAYGIAGLRVGFGIARPEVIAAMAPYRPPGSVSVVSVAVGARLLEEPGLAGARVAATVAERERLAAALRDAGWAVGPSATNFLLVDFGSAGRAAEVAEALLRRGLVPRTFGPAHPLASALRLTVRDREQDDRLIEAAQDLAAEGSAAGP